MKGKAKILLTIIEIVLIVVTALGFFMYSQKTMQPETVYTYNREMIVKTIITEQDIVATQIPSKAITADMVKNKEDIIGKAVTTKVFNGEYVVNKHLVEAEKVDVFEGMDLSNYRKFAVKADLAPGLQADLMRGQKVDLVYVGEIAPKDAPPKSDGTPRTDKFTYSSTFLQGILIYDVIDGSGNRYNPTTDKENQSEGEQPQTNDGKSGYIILAVTLDQFEELIVRMKSGEVHVVGRFDDSIDVVTKGYTYGDPLPITQGTGVVEVE